MQYANYFEYKVQLQVTSSLGKIPLLDLLNGRGITNCATFLYRNYRLTVANFLI